MGAYDTNLDSLTKHVKSARATKQATAAGGFSPALLASVDLPRLRAAANGNTHRLAGAFDWSLSPQGQAHWQAIHQQGFDTINGINDDAPSLFLKPEREWLAGLLRAATEQANP